MLRTADKRLFIGQRLEQVLRDPRLPVLRSMSAWYDASVVSSLTITSNKVSQWNDLSGNGHDLAQGTAGNRPLYDASPRTINGITIPEFTGSERMDSTCPMDDRTAALFIAMLPDAFAANRTPVADSAGGGWELRFNSSGTPQHLKSGVAVLATADFFLAPGTVQVYGSQLDASTHYFEFTGRQNTKSDGTTFTAGRTLRIGQDQSATVVYDGLIAELLIYSAKLTDAEVNQNMAYLAHKWY